MYLSRFWNLYRFSNLAVNADHLTLHKNEVPQEIFFNTGKQKPQFSMNLSAFTQGILKGKLPFFPFYLSL